MHADPPSSPLALAARRHADDVIKPQVRDWERRRRSRARLRPRPPATACSASSHRGRRRAGRLAGRGDGRLRGARARRRGLRLRALDAQRRRQHDRPLRHARAARALRARRSRAGELLGGFSLTEPHAGSDAAAITTRAVPVDDGWRVTGRKAWVSLAGEADVFVLVCRTGTERGTGDVLMLAVDARADGVRVERLYDKAAGAFLPIGEVSYDEVHVPAVRAARPAGPGHARRARSHRRRARGHRGDRGRPGAPRRSTVALDYARDREAFGGTLLDLQAIQFALADVETDIVAGRLLYRAAAAALDEGRGTRRSPRTPSASAPTRRCARRSPAARCWARTACCTSTRLRASSRTPRCCRSSTARPRCSASSSRAISRGADASRSESAPRRRRGRPERAAQARAAARSSRLRARPRPSRAGPP